ncbi:MAG: hypothetical protein MJZ75_00150 [Paludibacteraceae bacterium]|nr:hypothetical protein [Paludibacteraceae bacterium]
MANKTCKQDIVVDSIKKCAPLLHRCFTLGSSLLDRSLTVALGYWESGNYKGAFLQ